MPQKADIEINWFKFKMVQLLEILKEMKGMFMRLFCILFDLMMSLVFLLIGTVFYRSKGNAARFLSGYKVKFVEDSKKVDEIKMCMDYGKRIMLWTVPFLIGAIIDVRFPSIGTLIAWVIWIAMFILFLKYRRKREHYLLVCRINKKQ